MDKILRELAALLPFIPWMAFYFHIDVLLHGREHDDWQDTRPRG